MLCDYPFHEINELACSAVLTLNGEPKGGERGGLAPLSTGSSYYSMRRPKTLQQLLHHWGHCSARTCTSPRTLPSAAPLLFPLWGQSMSVFHTFSTPLTDALGLRLQPAAKDLVATVLPLATHKRHRVRVAAVRAVGAVMHQGAHEMILEMVAFR